MTSGRPSNEVAMLGVPGALLSLLVISGHLVAVAGQQSNYIPDSLFIALLGSGDALVEYDVKVPNPKADSTVTLFARQDVRDLIAADYNDRIIPFDPGQDRNQIIMNAPNTTAVRISYSTQDLVNKTGKVWQFSVNSPVGFSVKLPPDSVLTDYSGSSSPSINTVGGQYLLTFDPGVGNVSYVIGVVGTEEHASVLVKAAETTIREAHAQYPTIILADAEALLRNATTQLNARNFAVAEELAGRANDAASTTVSQYSDAKNAISNADSQIAAAAGQGAEVSAARSALQKAKDEFASGNYADAKNSAGDAVSAIGHAAPQDLPVGVIIVSVIAAGGAAAAMIFIRRRQKHGPRPAPVSESIDPPKTAQRTQETEELPPPEEQPRHPSITPTINPMSQGDSNLLSRIVARILKEKPHLRPEDQQVLQFLAEKEGAAFESEIRGKFLMPKTTIWRLVKRLEREELVEIRKAGGQNLIKLRFEGREP